MDFLKICWNSKYTKEEFIEKYRELDSDKQITVFKSICQLCSDINISISYFVPYFYAIFDEYPSKSFDSIDLNNKSEIDGCIRLINEFGSTLFNNLTIGTYENARCSIVILKIILLCQDNQLKKSVILILSRSQIYCSLLASARLHDTIEFKFVQKIFINSDLYKEIQNSESYSTYIPFLDTLTMNKLDLNNKYINPQEIVNVAILNNLPWILKNDLYSMFQPQLNYLFYVTSINRYISRPSLEIAYIITNFFLNFESKLIFDYNTVPFNAQVLNEYLTKLYSSSNVLPPVPLQDLYRFLSNVPENVPVEKLYEITKENPALSTSIGDIFLQTLYGANYELSMTIMKQIYENYDEFIVYFHFVDKIKDFINAALDIAENTTNEQLFHHSWTLAVTLVRFSIASGSPLFLREIPKIFTMRQSTSILLLRCMIDTTWSINEIRMRPTLNDCITEPSLMLKTVKFLCYLYNEKNEQSIINALSYLDQFPNFYIPAIVWGTRTKSPLIRYIPTKNLPDTPIHKYLFAQMLSLISLPAKITGWSIDYMDYITSIWDPEKHKIINTFLILRGIEKITLMRVTENNDTKRMFTIWRALIFLHGGKQFAKSLISALMQTSETSNETYFIQSLFISCAYHFIVLTEHSDSFLVDVMNAILDYLDSGERLTNGDAFALFCILCCLSLEKDHTVFYFNKLVEKSKEIIENANYQLNELTFFASQFLTKSLYSKALVQLLPDDIFKDLQKMSLWNSVIMFFIAKTEKAFE